MQFTTNPKIFPQNQGCIEVNMKVCTRLYQISTLLKSQHENNLQTKMATNCSNIFYIYAVLICTILFIATLLLLLNIVYIIVNAVS